jgi:hypothetical protein
LLSAHPRHIPAMQTQQNDGLEAYTSKISGDIS